MKRRHAFATRLWHWLNVLCLAVLLMSGLNISNAHPWLYWGDSGFQPMRAWAALPRFPHWMTIPDHYSLAAARDWHVLFAWVFALGLLLFMVASLANRHFKRDLVTHRREWRPRAVLADIGAHLRLRFAALHGGKYNFLQKLSYGVVIFILLPLMIATGMAISPGADAAWGWLGQALGGRQSARSLHFIAATLLTLFTIGHVLLVLLSGPWGQVKAMITGGRADDEAA
ncbi:cytochrome b/b6 domain-containing protein [Croceibacterium sp. TMG7-5b_MA50]|uniref:cytochrome b/b6 domain-containing protein n=1 Tax=Croceibacterium sp. TMG7-5b_MA50 TaxID=3121290 RepID=UPI0032219D35